MAKLSWILPSWLLQSAIEECFKLPRRAAVTSTLCLAVWLEWPEYPSNILFILKISHLLKSSLLVTGVPRQLPMQLNWENNIELRSVVSAKRRNNREERENAGGKYFFLSWCWERKTMCFHHCHRPTESCSPGRVSSLELWWLKS